MLGSITPHLIAIGVVFVLALVITFAVNRKTVADAATRKLIHSESWLVFLVAAVVAVAMMLFGPLATTDITNRITDDSATSLIAMRQATKNLLYTAVNSWMYENGEPQSTMPVWQVAAYAGIAVAAVAFLVLEALAIKRYRDRHKVARS